MTEEQRTMVGHDGPRESDRQALVRFTSAFMPHEPAALQRLLAWPEEDVELVPARAGGYGMRLGGVTLDSTYDPRRAAESLLARQDFDGVELVVLIGAGGGAMVEAMASALSRNMKLAIYEPNGAVLRALAPVFTGEALAGTLAEVFTRLSSLSLFVASHYEDLGRTIVIAPPVYQRLYPTVVEEVREALVEGMQLAIVSSNTQAERNTDWVRHAIANLEVLTPVPFIDPLAGAFTDVPAILCAAGPSLDKNIHQLTEVQDRALIFSVNTALRAVAAAGVSPHVVTCLEALDLSVQFAGLEDTLAEATLVLDQLSHQAAFSQPSAQTFTFVEASAPYLRFHHAITGRHVDGLCVGGSVANATFSLARFLGCNPIILVGQDLAYTGGRVYASETIFGDLDFDAGQDGVGTVHDTSGRKQEILDRSAEDGASPKTFMADRYIAQVPAWDGGEPVWTSADFNLFRCWFEEMAEHVTKAEGRTLINATEGGAHIEGFVHQTLAAAIDEHIDHRRSRDFRSELAELHANTPRLDRDHCRRQLQLSLRLVETIAMFAERAEGQRRRAVRVLEEQGPTSSAFAAAVESFGMAEQQVLERSLSHPLIDPCVAPSVRQVLRHRVDEEAPLAERWQHELGRSERVLALVDEALDFLAREIRQVLARSW